MGKRILLLNICLLLVLGSMSGAVLAAEETVRIEPTVSIGYEYMVALSAEGKAYAWGNNQNGVLGNGTGEDSTRPVAVSMPTVDNTTIRFSKISAGYDHVIALATNGTVWTWGSDADGQLGTREVEDHPESSNLPKQVKGSLENKKVVAVAAGAAFSLALTSEGNVYAWGSNQFGILGNLDQFLDGEGNRLLEYAVATPTRITALDAPFITDLFAGRQTAAAIDASGQVWLWGDNEDRQAGTSDLGEDGNANIVAVPVKKTTSAGYTATSVALGLDHTSFLMLDGSVASFGANKSGQFGNATTANNPTTIFKTLPNDTATMRKLAAGNAHGIALGVDGTVYAWGKNTDGILNGDSDTSVLNTPTPIDSDLWGTPVSVAAGYDGLAVIDDQGMVYTWGINEKGQLGNGGRSPLESTPVRVSSTEGNSYLQLGSGPADTVHQTQITLKATVPAPTFAISIPATVDAGDLVQKHAGDADAISSTAFEVRANQVDYLFSEKQIVVEVSAPDGVFCLKDEEFSLAYSVYNTRSGGEPLASGDRFAVFLDNGAANGRIEIDQSQITRAGSYSGRMIFTVKVTEREVVEP